MRKISQWQIRMQTMVPSLARSDRLSVFQFYALPANATRQWYFENCFQGRTNLPNANKMQKKIILIQSVGELVSAQMLSILSPTLFTRLVESNIWDLEIELCAKVSGIAGWQTLQLLEGIEIYSEELFWRPRKRFWREVNGFFRRSFRWDKFGDDKIREV